MSVNRNRTHLLVLPEDDKNLQLATGFALESANRQIRPLPVAGGWRAVLQRFQFEHVAKMQQFPGRLMVLLIDFDRSHDRLAEVKGVVPGHLADRVFVLGTWTEPEDLKKAGLGSYETIGRSLARDCRFNTNTTWTHELLRHNAEELARLCKCIQPILIQ